MSKRRKEPEVIVFEEPKFKKRRPEKTICRSADVSQLFSAKPGGGGGGGGGDVAGSKQQQQPEELDFKATLREVQKYAKNEKMPYPLYQKRVKAQRKRERKERRELLLAGTPVPKKKERQRKRGRGRWADRTRRIKPHIGSITGGVLTLSKTDIARVRKSSATRKH